MKKPIDKTLAIKELTMALTRLDNLMKDDDLPAHLRTTVESIKINVEDAINNGIPVAFKQELPKTAMERLRERRSQSRSDAMVRRHAQAGNTSVREK